MTEELDPPLTMRSLAEIKTEKKTECQSMINTSTFSKTVKLESEMSS